MMTLILRLTIKILSILRLTFDIFPQCLTEKFLRLSLFTINGMIKTINTIKSIPRAANLDR